MRILFINSVCGISSTGRICAAAAEELTAQGHECRIAYGRKSFVPERYKQYAVRIGSGLSVRFHAAEARLLDDAGFGSRIATLRFLRWVKRFDPDMIWLHNLHGYYLNVGMLFRYLKAADKPVIWTLHDCWAFTGHCAHFTPAGCEQWKTGCRSCPLKKDYPRSALLDACERNYRKKKASFQGVRQLRLVTPSQWLADRVGESFLAEYPIEVRHNTIDTEVFLPTPGFPAERYGLLHKKIVLGAASDWTQRKGLDDFVTLSGMLDEDYRIVLVGLTKKQIKRMPPQIVGIERLNDAAELAKLYTAADVFLNLTYADTYPTVNLEAKACGTPVVTYRTGGSPESASPENVVEPGDLRGILKRIEALTKNDADGTGRHN